MSKRARLSEDEAKKAGLKAWETPEGRRWLLKALNPNDVGVVSAGIPTLHCRNISILNWQGEYSVDVPSNINEEVPNYDTTMFLYQHPLIFGMSASRPQGCIDMRDADAAFIIRRTQIPDTQMYHYRIELSNSVGSPITWTRCAQYLNGQVDPTVFGGDKCLAARRKLYAQLTQKSRVAYGGATIIPTCSAENNSGTLAVCQQVYSPRKVPIEENTNIELDSFTESDFPDTSDLVQNPQMYYGRFQDGAYIPYKLNDPSSMEYQSSEKEMTTRSPYYIEKVTLIGSIADDGLGTLGMLGEVPLTCSGPDTVNFKMEDQSETGLGHLLAIRFYVQTYTGQRGYFQASLAAGAPGEGGNVDVSRALVTSSFFYIDENTKANNVGRDKYLIIEGAILPDGWVDCELDGKFFYLPKYLTTYNWNDDRKELANCSNINWISKDIAISAAAIRADPELGKGTICPYNGQSLITIHMSGISNTAPIKMLHRYGVEVLLVSASAYSPFKFMSPKYDESAIKSYARCIRTMKDAYFANTGSVVGQVDYNNKLMTLIENDSVEELNRGLNQGGSWTGVVGKY